MATIDWKTLWPLANDANTFISLEQETRSAFLVRADTAVGALAKFYHEQLAKYADMPYEDFMAFSQRWLPKESEQLTKVAGTPNEGKMEAFYLALREAYQRQVRKRDAPTQMALDYLYNQQETPDATSGD